MMSNTLRLSLNLLFLAFCALADEAQAQKTRPHKVQQKDVSVTSFRSKDGLLSSQIIRTINGSILNWMDGTKLLKTMIITPKYQVTKFGNSHGHFRFIRISKKENRGQLVFTLEYDQIQKKYQPHKLLLLPYKVLSAVVLCDKDSFNRRTKEIQRVLWMQEESNVLAKLENSTSISSTCKDLTEPDRTTFFSGLARGILKNKVDKERIKCLKENDPTYPLLFTFFYGNVLLGSSDFQLTCEPIKNGDAAQYESRDPTDIMRFDTPFPQGSTSSYIENKSAHEFFHGVGRKILASGSLSNDDHAAINCCLNNQIDKCVSHSERLKAEYEKSLASLVALPTLQAHFASRLENVDEEALESIQAAQAAFDEVHRLFETQHPNCVKEGSITETCNKDLISTLIAFQSEQLAKFSLKDGIPNEQNIEVDMNLSMKRVQDGNLLLRAKTQSSKNEIILTQSTKPIDLPENLPPIEVMQLSALAEEMEIHYPDGGPKKIKFDENAERAVQTEDTMAKLMFEYLVKPAKAEPLPTPTLATQTRSPASIPIANSGKTSGSNNQIAVFVAAAQGTGNYKEYIDEGRKQTLASGLPASQTSNRLPASESSDQPTRIPFGNSPRSPASTSPKPTATTAALDTSSASAPGSRAPAGGSSASSMSGFSPTEIYEPRAFKKSARTPSATPAPKPTDATVALWDRIKTRGYWSETVEDSRDFPALQALLKKEGVEVIRGNTKLIQTPSPRTTYRIYDDDKLVIVPKRTQESGD